MLDPSSETKIPHAQEQVSLLTPTTEPNALWSLSSTTREAHMLQQRHSAAKKIYKK